MDTGGWCQAHVVPDHKLNMWPPSNIHALPSKGEIQQIKEEILSMELEIVEARLKIKALRKSVAERKAWIAPIRKLPYEILSHILVDVSMERWSAPLTLQSVCRWWREVVVGSPRAWAFIPLATYDYAGFSELVSLFVERSRDATLHIYVRDHHFLPKMKALAHRIECMSIFTSLDPITCFIPGQYDFTRLVRLHLSASNWSSDPNARFIGSNWDMMHFPNLKILELDVRGPLLDAIARSTQFPPIRHLTVNCRDPFPLTDILMKCANSLESMVWVCLGQQPLGRPIAGPTIHLPFLRYIRLDDNTTGCRSPWSFEGSTPNLEAYSDDGEWSTTDTFKFDTSNVTFLCVRKAPDLSRFPRLVTLHIRGRGKVLMEAINSLRKRPQCSPVLAVIEYIEHISHEELEEEAKAALLTYAEETGRRVELVLISWEQDKDRRGRLIQEPVRVLANDKRRV
jgi:hypothetical protein